MRLRDRFAHAVAGSDDPQAVVARPWRSSRSRARRLRLRTAPSLIPSSLATTATGRVVEVAAHEHDPVELVETGQRLGQREPHHR